MTKQPRNVRILYGKAGDFVSAPIEIERKFVVAMLKTDELAQLEGYTSSEIDQTYLISEEHVTRRVRARRYGDRTVYTETKKIRIDKSSAYEDERILTEAEYRSLLSEIAPGTVTLRKTRHTFPYAGRVFEVDVYPEWVRSCILEVELDSRDAVVEMPEFVSVIAEVTGEKRYSNAEMSREFPEELI